MDSQEKLEIKKDYTETILKSIFGLVPHVGSLLNELFFERRSRLKQNRINHFVEEFAEFAKKVNAKEYDLEYIQSNDFSDIFESILRSISLTSNKEKIEKLKIILKSTGYQLFSTSLSNKPIQLNLQKATHKKRNNYFFLSKDIIPNIQNQLKKEIEFLIFQIRLFPSYTRHIPPFHVVEFIGRKWCGVLWITE